MRGVWPARPSPDARASGSIGFSLIELLIVMAVLGLLLAIAAPAFVTLGPSRKTGIHELAGFLEHARSRAVATRGEMIVAFADEGFPDPDRALRAYAMFEPYPSDAEGADSLRQVTPWRSLPTGLVFASGEHFDVVSGTDFRTVMNRAAERPFPVPDDRGERSGTWSLPCIVFGPDGGIREPAFRDADALHVGIIEGFCDATTRRIVVTAQQGGGFPSGECLSIGFYTGRTRLLTD